VKTYTVKAGEVKRDWYVVDAESMVTWSSVASRCSMPRS